MELIGQEVSGDHDIEIPEQVRDVYRLWRPTPLFRARRLERALGTPAHIYYKYEGGSPAGSPKPNTAVPQAFANAQAGIRKLTTETGAGQWGSSLAFACSLLDLECEVFMVGSSYDQKPYRRSMMQTWGATVHRSPSTLTQSGQANAEHATGSLGIAISEAVEVAAQDPDANYALGSVLNHVLLHQTIIGQETIAQMEMAARSPTSSSAASAAARTSATRPASRRSCRCTRWATASCRRRCTPAGLRYHGDAPMVCALLKAGMLEARAYRQNETFAAALDFARSEGIIPAPEPAHAIRAAIDEALAAKEGGDARVILFGLCGHGNFDLAAYDAYLAGTLEDPEFSQKDLDAALAALPDGAPSVA